MTDFNSLLLLLNARSKDFVYKICTESRNVHHTKDVLEVVTSTLNCSDKQASQLLDALRSLSDELLSKNISSQNEIIELFPQDFHKSLAGLLTKAFVELLPVWRLKAQQDAVSLPKLNSFSWSVNVDQDSKRSICCLNLNIEESKGPNIVQAQLSKEALTSLLAGLKQVKEQVNKISST